MFRLKAFQRSGGKKDKGIKSKSVDECDVAEEKNNHNTQICLI